MSVTTEYFCITYRIKEVQNFDYEVQPRIPRHLKSKQNVITKYIFYTL